MNTLAVVPSTTSAGLPATIAVPGYGLVPSPHSEKQIDDLNAIMQLFRQAWNDPQNHPEAHKWHFFAISLRDPNVALEFLNQWPNNLARNEKIWAALEFEAPLIPIPNVVMNLIIQYGWTDDLSLREFLNTKSPSYGMSYNVQREFFQVEAISFLKESVRLYQENPTEEPIKREARFKLIQSLIRAEADVSGERLHLGSLAGEVLLRTIYSKPSNPETDKVIALLESGYHSTPPRMSIPAIKKDLEQVAKLGKAFCGLFAIMCIAAVVNLLFFSSTVQDPSQQRM